MKYPMLGNIPGKSTFVTAFGGYMHGEKASVSSFYDMKNLSADKYPFLAVRSGRAKWSVSPASGIFGENGAISPEGGRVVSAAAADGRIVFCTETKIYADGQAIPGLTLPGGEHRITAFGRNFFVYPEGLYVEKNASGYTVKRAKYDYDCANVLVKLCDADGTEMTFDGSGTALPTSPTSGTRFLLLGEKASYLYTYTNAWNTGVKVYLSLYASGAGQYAYKGEKRKIGRLALENDTVTVEKCSASTLVVDVNCRIPSPIVASEGQLVFSSLRFHKEMPVLDLVTERDNRLWGCRYGDDGNGNFVNELYACAQGDPTGWDVFEGISTDSYRVSLGCPGRFTGACSLSGETLFFKEDRIVRVSGSTPSEFYVTSFPARGVEAGAADTLVILNEKAFYKSPSGITVYDGALPYRISDALGTLAFEGAAAGAENGKYYLKIRENGENALLVYDTKTGLWHREDDEENAEFFIPVSGRLFALCRGENAYSVWTVSPPRSDAYDLFRFTPPSSAEYTYIEEGPCEWFAVTGDLCAAYAGTRYIRSMSFRVSAEKDAVFGVSACCNNEPFFRELCTLNGVRPGLVTLRVNVPRCESFVLKLGGKGECTVHSVNIVTETASEVSAHV